jgi:hypothetical protein
MKKSVLIFILIMFSLPFILSATNVSIETTDETQDKVDLAYQCLSDTIEERGCDEISLSEKIFTVLATGKCEAELIDSSDNEECWPESGGCEVKETAQAILALKRASISVDEPLEWLLEQNRSPEELDWFLQIDGNEKMNCKIVYNDASYSTVMNQDKTLSSGAGSCLSRDFNNYWLKISSSCYSEDFEISCDQSFQTNLLYRKKGSSVIYVSENTNSAPGSGTTEENINSQCFMKDGVCDYESTLWASLVLRYLDYDVSDFWPYLQTMKDENTKLIPDSFLYYISDEILYKTGLLELQKPDGFWEESGDKFYDTAIASLSIQREDLPQKEKTKAWLLTSGVQDKDGCWKGNILNTAFLLYSIWPKDLVGTGSSSAVDCEDSGYYCMTPLNCEGNKLNSYTCSGVSICCDTPQIIETCEQQGGEICNSNQICSGGQNVNAGNLNLGEICCVAGACSEKVAQTECESNFGTCASFGCASTEEEANLACGDSTQVCCVAKTTPTSSGSWLWFWIILLIILIALIVLAIIYRDKLRPYWNKLKDKWNKFKNKFRKGGASPANSRRGPPGVPPLRSSMSSRNIPFQGNRPTLRPVNYPPQRKSSSDMDDVLKKLKEMSK